MKKTIFKTSALAVISLALLTACSPTSDTVKPTVSPTPRPTASATTTPTPSATATSTPTAEPSAAPSEAPAPTLPDDVVTLTADSIKILDDGVEREYGYKQAPATVIADLNDVFGYDAEYYFTGETNPCNYNVSEYTWNNFTLSFPGQNDHTDEGYIIYVDGKKESNDVRVQSTSGIVLGDSLDSAKADAGPDALYTAFDMAGSPMEGKQFGILLDGQSKANPVGVMTNGDGSTTEVTPNGTLVSIEDNEVLRFISPQYVHADC